MKREILINANPRETRVAIIEDDQLVELLVDRPEARRMVGDIYLGKVEAVLPGIQAAFVDIGTEKSAFLHASDLVFDEDGEDDDEEEEAGDAEDTPTRGRRAKAPPIQDLLKRGQEILVQISKEPIGTKGARVTSHVSLPGRYAVYLPTVEHVGVSKRIGSARERARLR
jgi:ribonuclease G